MRKPARLPLEALAPYLLEFPPLAPLGRGAGGEGYDPEGNPYPSPQPSPQRGEGANPSIDWPTVFRNANPIEIEIGFGKGLFLVTAGQANPETNYLGIEVLRALQLYAATRLAKRQLANVRVACTDARWFLHNRVSPGSVAAVHVYFPDPWWKKRHHKRRVWTPDFAADCVRVLQPGGKLHVATDVPAYFEMIRELLDGQVGLRRLRAAEQTGPPRPEEILTNFERKARDKGGSVFRAEYERV